MMSANRCPVVNLEDGGMTLRTDLDRACLAIMAPLRCSKYRRRLKDGGSMPLVRRNSERPEVFCRARRKP